MERKVDAKDGNKMFQFGFQPNMQLVNPPFTVIGVEPRPDMPGKVGFQFTLPAMPHPISFTVFFDRNQAEDFMGKLRQGMDTAKGLKK